MFAAMAFSLIHFYYFAIIVFTVSFFFLFYFLRRPRLRRLPALALHYSVQLIVPLLIFTYWTADGIADRTAYPWGFFHYLGIWEGTFTSMLQPHFQWIDQHLIEIERPEYEGRAYVGMAGLLATVVLVVRWALRRFRRPPFELSSRYSRFLQTLFFASIPVLLFSYGYPFVIPGLEDLFDHTGPLRQFRSVGRFSWLYYYVINLVALAGLYEWCRADRRRWVAGGLLIAFVAWEAWHFQRALDLRLDDIPEWRAGNRFTELAGINYNDYQAILPVPYYNVGSDNYLGDFRGLVAQKSLTLSVQTGLPTTGAMLTRTSLSQTLRQLQLVTEPYRPPAIFADFPDDRPLLMAYDTEGVEKLSGKYSHLTVGARLLYEDPPLRLYELPLSAFAEQRARRQARIREEVNDTTLFWSGEFGRRDSLAAFYYQSFDSLQAARAYQGAGALEGRARHDNLLLDRSLPGQEAGQTYVISFWTYGAQDLIGRSDLTLEEYDPVDGRVLQRMSSQLFWKVTLFDPNGWVLVEWPVKVAEADTRLRLHFRNGDAGRDDRLWVDELLIRPQGLDLYRRTDAYLWKNNRWFPVAQ